MELPLVLRTLATEHRRFERDRVEWDLERAELRSRVAVLEGEKRALDESLALLSHRCRMLEFALKSFVFLYVVFNGVEKPLRRISMEIRRMLFISTTNYRKIT